MLDDADTNAPGRDPPDADRLYRNYRAQCRRMGVKPVSPARAKALIKEWSDTIAASRSLPPPTEH